MGDLRRCVDELAADDLDGRADAALSHDLVAIRREIDRLEAEFSRRLRRFDRARGYVGDGAATLVSWLRHLCRLSGGAAHERVEVARELEQLPATESAWREGEIGYQHAAVIAHSAAEVGVEAVRAVEADLLEAAGRLDPGRLRQVTRYLRYCVDPDGALDADNAAHQRRFFNLSQTLDGVFMVDGQLDAEAGARLRTAINALNVPLPGETRTAGQRRADALDELVTRQLQGGSLPTTHGQRPHLVVTVPAASLQTEGDGPPAELTGAGPISSTAAQRLACDAAVTEVPVDSSGIPVAAGSSTRTIPAALRTSLAVRDRGCRFPTCDRPVEWTDAHHIRFRAHGGPTTLGNLALLCRTHHGYVHEGGWRLAWGEGGAILATPP